MFYLLLSGTIFFNLSLQRHQSFRNKKIRHSDFFLINFLNCRKIILKSSFEVSNILNWEYFQFSTYLPFCLHHWRSWNCELKAAWGACQWGWWNSAHKGMGLSANCTPAMDWGPCRDAGQPYHVSLGLGMHLRCWVLQYIKWCQ